jgi:hypothetical protein
MSWQSVVGKLHSVVHNVVNSVLTTLIYLSLLLAVGHYFGWLERWIWFILETEAKKILNSTKVTIGSFKIDWSMILQGKITLHASNVVIHTPQKEEWMWESPLIARVGKASVVCNAPITIFHEVLLKRDVPIEAYTIQVSDVQVFVERRQSVMNVYLLNKGLILPPPPQRLKRVRLGTDDSIGNGDVSYDVTTNHEKVPPSTSPTDPVSYLPSKGSSNSFTEFQNTVQEECKLLPDNNTGSANSNTTVPTSPDAEDHHNEQAKKLVNEMLHAVQDLGRAATRGQLPGAIKQQGLELVDRLRGFRKQDNLDEGLRVIHQFGKVAVESLQNAPKLLPQPNSKVKQKKIFVRVGRVAIREMRIFTKDSWIKVSNDESEATSVTATAVAGGSGPSGPINTASGGVTNNTRIVVGNSDSSSSGSWNKPIYIEQMIVRPSELCPPMSMKDDQDLPAIYQPADRVAEVVWRRLLAEMAKSNSGKLFSTAMGEVLSVMLTNPNSVSSSSGPGSIAAPPSVSASSASLP